MLDTLFWIAVFVSIACGILIMGIELYDEWAEIASCYNIVEEDLKNSGYLSASSLAVGTLPQIKPSPENRPSKLNLDIFGIFITLSHLTAGRALVTIGLVVVFTLAIGYAFSSPTDAVAKMQSINSPSNDIKSLSIDIDLRLVKFSE